MKNFRLILIIMIGSCLSLFSQTSLSGKPASIPGETVKAGIYFNKINDDSPANFELYQNYPNPFNPNTRIKFDIPLSSKVEIDVCSLDGNPVKQLVKGKLNAGTYSIDWYANDIPAGIYIYELKSGDVKLTHKMILAK